ncbi:MAG: dicarboxylate/amino acid:cation symporter [bacterium]|nr:dicarboxylate/amino acid:cation symporter [bacterium]
MSSRWLLTALILGGLILGVVIGQLLHDPAYDAADPSAVHAHGTALAIFDFLGFTVFMGLLKMLIVPLIASSVIVGVTSVGDFSRLGRMGACTLAYYFATMLVAVVIGLVIVSMLQPGAPLVDTLGSAALPEYQPDESVRATADAGLIGVAKNLVSQMIPTNIVAAMAKGQPLGVITFSIFFGVVMTLVGARAQPVTDFVNGVFEVLMKMVHAIMWLAPVGVFALLAWTVMRIGLGVFSGAIGLYMIAVLLGLALHGLIVLPLVLRVFGRTAPLRFLHQMRQALMTALATDSSSATLPVTLECATESAGVNRRTAGFVLPLGATINMDGTALYEAVAVVFMAQAFGVELSMIQLIIVAVTATLAAVGAAGIPSAGLVTMVIVVDAVNGSLSAAGGATIPIAGIGLIIGVDRILDMFRTVVNVWGDAVGAKIIDRVAGDGEAHDERPTADSAPIG